jgi:hypothetical protein
MRGRARSDTAPVTLVVLVVGVSARFLERFRVAAAPRKAEIVFCDVSNFQRTAALRVPRSIVVSDHAYARSPATYDTVTSEVCARLVRVPDEEIDEAQIEALVDTTVRWA